MFIHAEIKTITKWTPKNHEIKNLAQTHKMYADWGSKKVFKPKRSYHWKNGLVG